MLRLNYFKNFNLWSIPIYYIYRYEYMFRLLLYAKHYEMNKKLHVIICNYIFWSDLLKEGRPDIIFVMLDTLRADYLKVYGGNLRMRTIDSISKKSVIYKKAVSQGTWTVPSHASLFLGRRVKSIKAINRDSLKDYNTNTDPFLRKSEYIGSNEITLAKHMSYLGYKTALFSNSPFIGSSTGLANGFMHVYNVWFKEKIESNNLLVRASLSIVDDDTIRNRLIEFACLIARLIPKERLDKLYLGLRKKLNKKFSNTYGFYNIDSGAESTNALVERYLRTNKEDSNFIFINYMEGHEGYPTNLVKNSYVEQDKWLYMSGIADPNDVRIISEAYKKRFIYLDSKIADLLEILKTNGVLDNAVLILASDHGQAFMEHGQLYHNMFPYEEITRVPLIIARFKNGKQVNNSEEVDKFVSLTALYDSILNIGYGKTDEINGQLRRDNFVFSDHVGITEVWDTYLLKLLRARSKYVDAIYRAKLTYNTFATAIYYKNFKLISYKNGRKELYNIEEDANEIENVMEKNRGVVLEMLNAEKAGSKPSGKGVWT
jgi:hypothetical protein